MSKPRAGQSLPPYPGYRAYGDTIQEQITFFDHKESYKVESINHESVANISHNQLGGATSSGEFGSMLSHIFDPDTGAEFDWDHWATLRGRRMYVFSFKVPKSAGYSRSRRIEARVCLGIHWPGLCGS